MSGDVTIERVRKQVCIEVFFSASLALILGGFSALSGLVPKDRYGDEVWAASSYPLFSLLFLPFSAALSVHPGLGTDLALHRFHTTFLGAT